ncbi:MAG: hypothetical protein QM723_17930 [Myxococcaceae bacterium]
METPLETLRARLTVQCETLREWHRFAMVILARSDGSMLASSEARPGEQASSQLVVKLVFERLIFIAVAQAGGERYLSWLNLPDHAWFKSVESDLQKYLEAAGAETAGRELPVVTEADVDRLFNRPTAP